MLIHRDYSSPVGKLRLVASSTGLRAVLWEEDARYAFESKPATSKLLTQVAKQLDEYFAGRRHAFDLPLDWRLSAGFRRTVLSHLPEIGYGHTASYSAVAQLAGRPRAVRAVGTACATNPLPLVVPCHRVVRADGSMGGYRGGPEAKRTLLTLEEAAA